MSKNAESVKRLRAYYKNRLAIPDSGAMQAELTGASDRSVVITLAAFLDSALEYLISTHMRPLTTLAEFEDAFGQNSPLGSFSAKIKMAHLFKIIDDLVKDQLDDIRELRNACAHSRLPMTFATPQLASVAKRILHPKGSFRLQADTPEAVKGAFTAECMFLHGVLLWGRDKAVEEVRASYRRAGHEPPF
jgi:hypothetical protein